MAILHVDSSARFDGSASRDLTAKLVSKLSANGTEVITRDLGKSSIPFVDEAWIGANFTDESDRTDGQRAILAKSDVLIDELERADTYVIGVPMYNFGVPAVFKAWIDQIARARKTFRYSATGPVGLLEGKRAYVVIASGGTEADSAIDFATGYVRHVLGFIGVSNVEFIFADKLMFDGETKTAAAKAQIEAIDTLVAA